MSDFADFDHRFLRGLIEMDESLAAAVEPPRAADAETFKAAMRVLASGVVMVTARVEDRIWGLTISACCSISASPPMVLISLAHSASCLPAVLETRRFGLSILRADQRPLAELGAVPGGPKYVETFVDGPDGSTRIGDAVAHLDCVVERSFEVADHTVVVGRVEHAFASEDGLDDPGPLLYFNRTFHALGSPFHSV